MFHRRITFSFVPQSTATDIKAFIRSVDVLYSVQPPTQSMSLIHPSGC